MQTFRARGFLTPEQWADALTAAGFAASRSCPCRAHPDVFPGFCAAAIGATRE